MWLTANYSPVGEDAIAHAHVIKTEALRKLGRMLKETPGNEGESGTGVSGSILDVLAESTENAELDMMNILYGGELQARGFESTATLDRMAGKNAKRAGLFSAASNALIGGAGAYGAYLKQQ